MAAGRELWGEEYTSGACKRLQCNALGAATVLVVLTCGEERGEDVEAVG